MGHRLTLILGGARSAKSRHAEALAVRSGGSVLFVATAEALDEEMHARIEAHRKDRPAAWKTLEAPTGVGEAISKRGEDPEVVLLDCITLLASNVFGREVEEDPAKLRNGEAALMGEIDSLLRAYQASSAVWIVISNEVGLGLVPPTPLGRAYRDALGRANQQLAEAADEVLFMVAGLPLTVKGPGASS